MSGKGHRKLRLCSRKNYEQKKYDSTSLIISIPRTGLSFPTVSPSPQLPDPPDLVVSLPISAFQDSTFRNVSALETRLRHIGTLISGLCGVSYCNGSV